MNTVTDRVHEAAAPILRDLGLELFDLELAGSTLRLTVDREGGVDLDAIARASRMIGRELDHRELLDSYSLEVSSPGLERRLRRPEHFRTAIGTTVSVRTVAGAEGERRVQGELTAVDSEGFTIRVGDGSQRHLRYDEVERARTVFEWGAPARPAKGPAKSAAKRPAKSAAKSAAKRPTPKTNKGVSR